MKFEKKNLTGYLDAANLGSGSYDLSIVLNYEGLTTKATGVLDVTGERGIKKMIEAPAEISGYLTATNLLILVIILLVLMNVWLYRRRKRENEGGQNQGKETQQEQQGASEGKP